MPPERLWQELRLVSSCLCLLNVLVRFPKPHHEASRSLEPIRAARASHWTRFCVGYSRSLLECADLSALWAQKDLSLRRGRVQRLAAIRERCGRMNDGDSRLREGGDRSPHSKTSNSHSSG